MSTLAPWAQQLARELLQEPLPRRWAHVRGVGTRARGLAPVLGADADLIEAGERGLVDVLNSEFDPPPDVLASTLTCCDMTTSRTASPCRLSSDSPRHMTATAQGTW